ncbi:MAG: DUF429 domain-containing protein [Pseudanabaenaceae cyanobacterium]
MPAGEPVRFLGIDFGWRSQPSGLCCLEWAEGQLVILDLCRLESVPEILGWVEQWAEANTGIAVDAPTIITNPTGMRPCDRLTHKYFGKYDAGCYPANLSRPFAQRTVSFGESLQKFGFSFAPTMPPRRTGRWQIEVFPHTAIIHLFQLPKIIKYKKGKIESRIHAIQQLHRLICTVLPQLEPSLHSRHQWLEEMTWQGITGKQLKVMEDQLDSLICAYTCAYWWYWGTARNLVLGDADTGFIVVPSLREPATQVHCKR